MRILVLGYGTGDATIAWTAHGHTVVGVDWKTMASINGNYFKEETWEKIYRFGPYDWVWFAPDCAQFSLAGSLSWDRNYQPTSDKARTEYEGVKFVIGKIKELNPSYGWMMENPRAMMRKMDFVQDLHRVTVSYCQYGDSRMKPTDLFGVIPYTFDARFCFNGASCHDSAPRGSKTGTQGLNRVDAGRMPYQLSKEIMEAVIESKGRTFPTLGEF